MDFCKKLLRRACEIYCFGRMGSKEYDFSSYRLYHFQKMPKRMRHISLIFSTLLFISTFFLLPLFSVKTRGQNGGQNAAIILSGHKSLRRSPCFNQRCVSLHTGKIEKKIMYLFLDFCPDYSCHFIPIDFHHRISYRDSPSVGAD